MKFVQKITPEEVLPLRRDLLRENAELEECIFSGDDYQNSFHLGLQNGSGLFGIASFLAQNNPEISGNPAFRLRGMAVKPKFQQQGNGKNLLFAGLQELKKRNVRGLWFNAREEAVGFYEKQGFRIKGGEFIIPKVGPHFLMSGQVGELLGGNEKQTRFNSLG